MSSTCFSRQFSLINFSRLVRPSYGSQEGFAHSHAVQRYHQLLILFSIYFIYFLTIVFLSIFMWLFLDLIFQSIGIKLFCITQLPTKGGNAVDCYVISMCSTDVGDNKCRIQGFLKIQNGGVILEQELLHVIFLQRINCLLSFTREIEKNVKQETRLRHFKGSFYYLNVKQS